MKVKLLKMTEETPEIPAIDAKLPTNRVETSSVKNKTLVKELRGLNPCNRSSHQQREWKPVPLKIKHL